MGDSLILRLFYISFLIQIGLGFYSLSAYFFWGVAQSVSESYAPTALPVTVASPTIFVGLFLRLVSVPFVTELMISAPVLENGGDRVPWAGKHLGRGNG